MNKVKLSLNFTLILLKHFTYNK